MIPLDTHTHSTLSFDGDDSPRQMIEQAIQLGMKIFASTEHLDANVFYEEKYNQDVLIPKGHEIINQLKAEYADRIKIIYGVEFAQSVHDVSFTKELIAKYNFDFILGSVHAIRDEEDFYYIDYSKRDVHDLMRRYFDEVYETVELGVIDSIAHLTYPVRYIIGRQGIDFDVSVFDERIKDIFRLMIKKDIALELNTCGLRNKAYNHPDPHFRYLEVYRSLGGKLLTIGSDAHRTTDLGVGINDAIAKAKAAGFSEIAWYEQRQPQFVSI